MNTKNFTRAFASVALLVFAAGTLATPADARHRKVTKNASIKRPFGAQSAKKVPGSEGTSGAHSGNQ